MMSVSVKASRTQVRAGTWRGFPKSVACPWHHLFCSALLRAPSEGKLGLARHISPLLFGAGEGSCDGDKVSPRVLCPCLGNADYAGACRAGGLQEVTRPPGRAVMGHRWEQHGLQYLPVPGSAMSPGHTLCHQGRSHLQTHMATTSNPLCLMQYPQTPHEYWQQLKGAAETGGAESVPRTLPISQPVVGGGQCGHLQGRCQYLQ